MQKHIRLRFFAVERAEAEIQKLVARSKWSFVCGFLLPLEKFVKCKWGWTEGAKKKSIVREGVCQDFNFNLNLKVTLFFYEDNKMEITKLTYKLQFYNKYIFKKHANMHNLKSLNLINVDAD